VRREELEAIESRITRRDLSLDDPAYVDTDETRGDRIADERPGPESRLAAEELADESRRRIREALEGLDPRERAIVSRRYLGARAATLKELGADLGISRERVRQLEARAKAKLRQKLAALREI
jgi:RNA polymerase sigma-32 factor